METESKVLSKSGVLEDTLGGALLIALKITGKYVSFARLNTPFGRQQTSGTNPVYNKTFFDP